MSDQFINSEMLWWNLLVEEETSPAVNLFLPQYYLVSSSPLVNEMPGDYLEQSFTPFPGTTSTELDIPNSASPSPPASSNGSTTSTETSNSQSGRRSRRRSSLDEAARIARRRERNRLAARRSRNRSRNYYNQLEQRVVELEDEITRLRSLLGHERNED
ncbi:unnamed protein product [Rhizophagus irregularis]|uniref:BZIP domain-containing protein n=1 Tax=Rhizophagus irregularis TaxID=588596 RepID=A0A2I1G4N9_9GLOM|nr:hypothetical protein RhiirA4_455222 [Rhizophagus irregularis]CAB4413437.1 unnamed protein product [Rhizophagus irregularis]